jgi:hypothetical protein
MTAAKRNSHEDTVFSYLGKLKVQGSRSLAKKMEEWKILFEEDKFVSCFCGSSDILSMWRGYAEHGGGYSIGFDVKGLLQLCRKHHDDALVQVCYGPTLPDNFKRVIKDLCRQYGTNQAQCVELMFTMFSMIKHRAFIGENEWRFVCSNVNQDKLKFRQSHNTIRAYTELGMPNQERLPLKKLIFGPTHKKEETKQTLEWMLNCYGYPTGSVDVKDSKVPYRL